MSKMWRKNKFYKIMRTKIICILDASGSMNSIIDDAIGGFNHFLNEQQQIDEEANIDVLLFDTEFNKIIDNKDIHDVKELTNDDYQAGGMTALYDAIGMSIDGELDKLGEDPNYKYDKTLCVIITDGFENMSNKYNQSMIKNMIEEMEEDFNWDFIFLAANQDAVLTASGMGIKAGKSISWTANSDGMNMAYQNMSKATSYYRTTDNINYDEIFKDSE